MNLRCLFEIGENEKHCFRVVNLSLLSHSSAVRGALRSMWGGVVEGLCVWGGVGVEGMYIVPLS